MFRGLTGCVAVLLLFGSSKTLAQGVQTTPDTQEILKALQALQRDVADIKEQLEQKQMRLPLGANAIAQTPEKTNKTLTLPFVPDHQRGSSTNDWVIVEFADLQCPFCAHFEKNASGPVVEAFVNTGRLRLLSVDFPLDSHPDALRLSTASVCAGEQGKYWEMRRGLLLAGEHYSSSTIQDIAGSFGLDMKRFETCNADTSKLDKIRVQSQLARQAGIYSTPSFLIGRVKGSSVTGTLLVGAMSPEEFKQEVEKIITQEEKSNADASSVIHDR